MFAKRAIHIPQIGSVKKSEIGVSEGRGKKIGKIHALPMWFEYMYKVTNTFQIEIQGRNGCGVNACFQIKKRRKMTVRKSEFE